MIRKSTWIVLGVFAVLLVAVEWWTTVGPAVETPTDTTPTPAPLWSIAPEDIQSIKVEALGSGTVVAAHREQASGWALDEPAGLADVGRLEIAADSLVSLIPSDTAQGTDLASYGLDSPGWHVTLNLNDGRRLELLVGQTSPTGGVVYVKQPDTDTVYFVNSYSIGTVTDLTDNPPVATPTPAPTEEPSLNPTDLPATNEPPAPSPTP
jgi:Domain of unknown function (DUF4340)